MSDPIIIIPARLDSRRLPRKALLAETGLPLIVHVVDRCLETGLRVVLATDSQEIIAAIGEACDTVLTGPCRNGTERCFLAARAMELPGDQVIVNVQGDQPELAPAAIKELVQLAAERNEGRATPDIWTLAAIRAWPPVVSVGFSGCGSPVKGFVRRHAWCDDAIHLGVYLYTVDQLFDYCSRHPSWDETEASLEQLRWYDVLNDDDRQKYTIRAATTAYWPSVDTPEDYAAFVARHQRSK